MCVYVCIYLYLFLPSWITLAHSQIAFSIESAKDTATTIAAMKEAKGALSVAYKGMEIDDIYVCCLCL